MVGATHMATNPAPLSLSGEEFVTWAELLAQRTGVVVPLERRTFLESNLRRRMRELNLTSFSEFQRLIEGPAGAQEWGTLVDRLTVHQTHFFRHLPSFELVRSKLLPEFVARGQDDFHAWSVGTSTGEEAWSLAMVIDHFANQQSQAMRFGITATDVSQPAITKAGQAEYQRSAMAEIPKGYRVRYCEQNERRGFTIAEKLKQRVRFAVLNLLHIDRQPVQDLDLIYCQNVLIYFPQERRNQILDQFAQCLRLGGCLILGPGETTSWSHPSLTRVADTRALAFEKAPTDGPQPVTASQGTMA